MTRFLLPLLLWVLTAGAVQASAQPDKGEALTPQAIAELTLDGLFAQLPEHAEARSGRMIEAEFLNRFNPSGSDTADLLMTWAAQAIDAKNYAQALDILDQVVLLRPKF